MVMYLCLHKQTAHRLSKLFRPSSRKIVKRRFLISNVAADKRKVRRGHVTRERDWIGNGEM